MDPTSRGFAYVVLEGPERLVDWGVAHVRNHSKHAYLERLMTLIDENAPDLIVTEDHESRRGRRHTRAKVVLHRIKAYMQQQGIATRVVTRSQVREVFQGSGETKQEIAEAIARFFPELESKLPRYRKPWMSEDERMNIFDALSFALTVLRSPEALREIVA